MKKTIKYGVFLFAVFLILPPEVYSRNDSIVNRTEEKIKNIVTVEEDVHRTRVTFPGGGMEVDEMNDTITKITIGRRRYLIIEKPGHHTRIQTVRIPRETFKGHWAGFDLGLTNFFSSPLESGLPAEDSWLDLNGGKSVVVGMNLLQYNIGLQKAKNNIGLVTGVGWTINNYRFDSKYVPVRDDEGMTSYIEAERHIEKSKLVTSFATVPLLFEFQLPTGGDDCGFFFSAGVYGSFRLGSHTKVVYNDDGGREKEKSRDDLNLNAFKYGAMVRTGYKWIKLYAKCDLTPLFEKDRGPEVYPWTVGVTLVRF
jgi:hypothetical protein